MFFLLSGLPFLACVIFLIHAIRTVQRASGPARWPTAVATITKCQIKSDSSGEGGPAYKLDLQYHYMVADKRYTGSTVAFGYGSTGRANGHQPIVDALTQAERVDVRYDPAHPAVSTLTFGLHRSAKVMLAFAIMLVLIVVGFTTIAFLSYQDDVTLLRNLSVH